MNFLIAARRLCAVALCTAAGSAAALPISDYSVITYGDFSSGSDVEGHAFVGGSLYHNNGFYESLTVVGDITANTNVIGREINLGGSVSANVHTDNIAINYVDQDILASQRDAMFAELQAASNLYGSTSANGVVTLEPNEQKGVTFSYDGADAVAYFNVDGSTLFSSQERLFTLDAGSASTAIINVSGTDLTAFSTNHFTSTFQDFGAENILWNFYEATTLNLLTGGTFQGSILALGAELTSLATLDGSIAALALHIQNEIHDHPFTPPPEVPLPATLPLFIAGLAMFGWLRRRTKHS